jgi:hypothetical protein
VSEVVLSYRRTGEEYSGIVFVDGEEKWATSSSSFAGLISRLSSILRDLKVEDCRLIFRRTDRPGLRDFIASAEETTLIRLQPLEYLKRTNGYDRTVVVRDSVPPEQKLKVYIRTGYDTLADAFGEHVYAQYRDDGKVECPCCGRWMAELDHYNVLSCRCIGRITTVRICGPWVEIPTPALTHLLTVQRFYMPRAWNLSGPWISRDNLSLKFNTYLQEAQDA